MDDPPLTIDLGLDREAPDPGPPPVQPWWRRGAAVVAVSVLVSAAAAGSAAPRPALADVFTVPVGRQGDVQVYLDALYVLRLDGTGATVAAYGLRDGVPRWTSPAPDDIVSADDSYLVVSGTTVAVVTSRDDPVEARTQVYDAGTGEPLWTRRGWPVPGGGPDRVLLSRRAPCPGSAGCGDSAGVREQEMVAVDRRSGGIAWTVRLDLGTSYATAPAMAPALAPALTPALTPAQFATVDGAGQLAVRDVTTGEVTATRTLGPLPHQRMMQFAGGILLVQVLGGLAGFDPVTLDPLWTVTMSLTGGGAEVWPCARLICASSPVGTYAIEPATGTVRWRLDRSMVFGQFDERHLMTHSTGGGPVERGFDADVEVIEVETGARLFVLRGWEPMAILTGTRYVLVHRWHDTRSLIWLGELRADQRAVRPVGALPGVGQWCTAARAGDGRHARSFLVCRTVDDRARVWRFTSSAGQGRPAGAPTRGGSRRPRHGWC